MEVKHFIRSYLDEIESGNAAVFAGAGMSVSAGCVDWKELLRPLAEELLLDVDEEHDLVALAQFHENKFNRQRISQRMFDEIGTSKEPTKNHEILASLPISTFWTTNYDKLLEKSLQNEGKVVDVKYVPSQLAITKSKRDACLYKIHGDIDTPDNTILTRNEYEKYPHSHAPFITALSGDLVSKTFLFIGFSFTDPNLQHVLSNIRIRFESSQRNHYCIFRRENRESYKDENSFVRATTRQELFAEDLGRFHINVIFVDEYYEITEILQKIERQFRRTSVFISGSAAEFGSWGKEDSEQALSKIGSALIDQEFKLVSGIGLGVGNAVVSGAICSAYKKQFTHLEDRLIMRPFPQYIDDPSERAQMWEEYRYDLISKAGIAIFILGNKLEGDHVVIADGVIKEYEIAKKLGLVVIPIGCSGYAAKQIWSEVMGQFEEIFPNDDGSLREKIELLGEDVDNPNEIISKVIDVLKHLIKE